MPAIILTKEQIQALIAYNKQQIAALEMHQNVLKESIQVLWEASNPIDTSVVSTTAFQCLNECKNSLRKVKKQIKLLAQVQYSLKQHVEI